MSKWSMIQTSRSRGPHGGGIEVTLASQEACKDHRFHFFMAVQPSLYVI